MSGPRRWRGETVSPAWLGTFRVLVGLGALVWSAYLAATGPEGGVFDLIVRAMGSAGLLYVLYLVTKPRRGGVTDLWRTPPGAEPSTQPARREGLGKPGDEELFEESREPSSGVSRAAIITIALALAIGAFAYNLFHDNYLHTTAAFFIGVPTVLAITLALTPKAKSATGLIIKGITLALLLSGIVFYEGFICILMAAPIFYVVGIAIGMPIDRARRRRTPEGRVYSIVGGALLLLSLEGVAPLTTLPTEEMVVATRVVNASPREVRAALSATPSFDRSLPPYLRLGFPRPVAARGAGLRVGDERTIVFGDESPMEPMADSGHDHHGAPLVSERSLRLQVTHRGPKRVVFEAVADVTPFTHWISWGRSEVEWEKIGPGETSVTWRLHFERKLSPAWYFRPWQRYAATEAAGYLIDTVATP